MSKRTAKQPVSYVEVDSDADLAASDDELMRSGNGDNAAGREGESLESGSRGKGDTYGARKPVKKKARKSTTAKDKGKGKEREKGGLDVKLLLDLPFDMLAEVCTHLRLADLVHLASTSRALRKLLSKSGAQLWGLVRRENGYVLPDGMSEIEFALLLEGKRCQSCGTKAHIETLYQLRIRLCDVCKKELIIRSRNTGHEMPYLHRLALDCSRSQPNRFNAKEYRYLKSDVDGVNDKLQSLEDDDEQARAENERFRWKTRSRGGGRNADALEDTDHVERWVEAEQARLAKEKAQMDVAVKRQQDQQQEQKIEDGKRARQLFDRLTSVLTSSHGWSQAQIQFHAWDGGRHETPPFSAPAETPEDNPEAWRVYRNATQQALDRKDADKRAAPGRRIRTNYLELKYTAINKADPRFQGVFPSFREFKTLETVKPLWHPENAQLNKSTWPDQEPLVLKALQDYAEAMRVHTIRVILAARTGQALERASRRTRPTTPPTSQRRLLRPHHGAVLYRAVHRRSFPGQRHQACRVSRRAASSRRVLDNRPAGPVQHDSPSRLGGPYGACCRQSRRGDGHARGARRPRLLVPLAGVPPQARSRPEALEDHGRAPQGEGSARFEAQSRRNCRARVRAAVHGRQGL